MRVAVYHSNDDIRIEERPEPRIGPGEMLVRVHAAGVCGTDVLEWYRMPKAPLVLGHEIAGEVMGIGDGVDGFTVGDRVTATHHVPCRECWYCRSGHATMCEMLRRTHFDPGGFSECLRLGREHVERGTLKLPSGLSFEEGSFTEPLGCAVRGQNLARVGPGATVVVLGSGTAGLLHIQLARARGARIVLATDVQDYRLAAARRFGADEVVDAREDLAARIKKVNDGRLADLVILCAGSPAALAQAFSSVDRGGTILLFAPLPPGSRPEVPLTELWWETVTITSSYAAAPEDLAEALELLGSGKVRVRDMVTDRVPLAETARGFKKVVEAGASLKVVVEPQR